MPRETTYTLTPTGDTPPIEEVAAKLAEIADHTPPGHPGHKSNTELWIENLEGAAALTWHNIEKDMAQVSVNWPSVLFTMECRGETSDDLWRVYARNGRYQVAKACITYHEPDPAQMKQP